MKTLSTLDIGDSCEISLLNYLKWTVPPLVLNKALETGGKMMPHLISKMKSSVSKLVKQWLVVKQVLMVEQWS